MSTKSVLNPNSGKQHIAAIKHTSNNQDCLTSSNRYNTRYQSLLRASPPDLEFVPKVDPDMKDPQLLPLISKKSKEHLQLPPMLAAIKEEVTDNPTAQPDSPINTKDIMILDQATKEPEVIMKEESQEIKTEIKDNILDQVGIIQATSCTNENGMQVMTKERSQEIKDTYEEIDTKVVARQIQAELKRMQIPQSSFAKQVLNRTQGTLSDLLRQPQPWSKLRSGRHTFRRMAEWLRMPDSKRSLIALYGKKTGEKPSLKMDRPKKKTVFFTGLQKNTLQAIFEENPRPSKIMIIMISRQLGLDLSTVQNYFMNARRRKRKSDIYNESIGGVKIEVVEHITGDLLSSDKITSCF